MNTIHTTSHTEITGTLIIGAGFAGLYLAHALHDLGYRDFLLVAPQGKTVSDVSYYNFRSRGVKQTSLRASIIEAGAGKCNPRLVSTLVHHIDDELTRLSTITKMHASYLGAQVSNPHELLRVLREKSAPQRRYAEVRAVRKDRGGCEAETDAGTILCRNVVFCTGGGRGHLSPKFADERVGHEAFSIAERLGCHIAARHLVMRHPFYTHGKCLPSDGLFGFEVVDARGARLPLTTALLASHNAHHRFDAICEEFERAGPRLAVKGDQRIPLSIEPHYRLGGMVIRAHGETTVRGVYAVGECSFGMHGHGRIGGSALSETVVMARVVAGRIVGE